MGAMPTDGPRPEPATWRIVTRVFGLTSAMTPGQRCDEIIKMIDEVLDAVVLVEFGVDVDAPHRRGADSQILRAPRDA